MLHRESQTALRIVLIASIPSIIIVSCVLVFRLLAAHKTNIPTQPVSQIESAVPETLESSLDTDQEESQLDTQSQTLHAVIPGANWTVDELNAINDVSEELFEGNAERAEYQQANAEFEKLFVFSDGQSLTIQYDYSTGIPESVEVSDDGVSGGFFGRKRANWTVLDFRGLVKWGIAGAVQVGP